LESWLVRRMIVRATTKGYNQTAAELVKEVRAGARDSAGDTVQRFLAGQSAPSKYWPDDDEIRDAAQVLQAYRHLRRRRLRMLLEAVEDHRRGFKDGEEGLGGQRVLRGKYAIEHVMPRKWQTHWSLDDPAAEADRDRLIHTFGNLTLLTKRLNGKVSNGPWEVKRAALKEHDTLKLSTDLIDDGASDWTEQSIRDRTTRMVDAILAIWRVPEGHRSSFRSQADRTRPKVEVADLVAAGFLAPGATLYSRREKFAGRTATVLPDGRLDVDGVAYETPTGAARAIIGKKAHINAWRWFLLGPDTKRTLSDLWHEYVDQMSSDADEADAPEDDEDGDTDDEGVE
ncbi:MAG: DUF1524 domain-containing protein, partial [Gemmatimonadales bacterium]|nr:DUF1524 domain-containing protein [Gemmatimonadales bacterium]